MRKTLNTATLLVVLLGSSLAIAQTKTAKPSNVGVWKLDVNQSKFGSEGAQKSATLTILTDTPETMAWRWEGVDATGKTVKFSWSGPPDGSMHDLLDGDGKPVGKESFKRDGDVAVRHGEIPNVEIMDARGTISADGNTFINVETSKTPDGKTATTTTVYHRVAGSKPASK